ncbi:hypothetical protein [Marinoscillum sp.]|uniref:hypothetical protein n=1 Tax=Marinoscillum sp. TaxID=2024838 RepID=UPI003BA9D4E5
MDDIQFWIYLVFGAIYLLSRFFKKNDKDATPRRTPRPQQQQPTSRPNKPVTFEELLKEFTEGKSEEEEVEVEKPEPVEARQLLKERKWQEENRPDFSQEGTTRRFSDEDSRRIYEESIKSAETSSASFERDDNFKLKVKSLEEEEEEQTDYAGDIASMLQNPNDARKAVILGEILNRKY